MSTLLCGNKCGSIAFFMGITVGLGVCKQMVGRDVVCRQTALCGCLKAGHNAVWISVDYRIESVVAVNLSTT